MKNIIIFLFLLVFNFSTAQVSITSGNPISITFNNYKGNGFSPAPAAGQLDSDHWRVTGLSFADAVFGGTYTTDDFARGANSGSISTGGLYAFEIAAGDTAFGIQPIGSDFTPGAITLRLVNNSGSVITELNLQYNIYVYNDQERANSFNFSYSEDDISYNDVSALDFTSVQQADTGPVWVSTTKGITLNSLTLADNDTIYLRWSGSDVSGSGSRDEFALDNILISEGDTPLPVELVLFRAIPADRQVKLRWQTASELNNQGFEIYRSYTRDKGFELIDSHTTNDNLKGAGTSSNAHNYFFTDYNVFNNQQYWYKLVDISFSGQSREHGPIYATPTAALITENPDQPAGFTLFQNFPNPFNPKTTIRFDVPENKDGTFVNLNIFNMLGEKVVTLYRGVC